MTAPKRCIIAAVDEVTYTLAQELACAIERYVRQLPAAHAIPVCVMRQKNLPAQSPTADEHCIILALTYAHTAPQSVFYLRQPPHFAQLCVMLNAPINFPFHRAIKRRAQRLLGQMPMIELPALDNTQAAVQDIIQEALAAIVQRLQPLSAATESVSPSVEYFSFNADHLSLLLGFNLTALYGDLRTQSSLFASLPASPSKSTAGELFHHLKTLVPQIDNMRDERAKRVGWRFCAVCYLRLYDFKVEAYEPAALPAAADQYLSAEEEAFFPLKCLGRILAAYETAKQAPARAQDWLAQIAQALKNIPNAQGYYLLDALLSRVQMMTATEAMRKEAAIKNLSALLPRLNNDEVIAIGAAEFARIHQLRQKIGDVL